jgi:polar amino acid transport system substrate-binding protein
VRKLASLLVVAVLAGGLTACGSDGDSRSGAGSGADGPVTRGRLTVGTSLPAPGFWNAATPEAVDGGFEYALAVEAARRLGLDGVDVVSVSFDALVAGQATGFDLALSQVTVSEERKDNVDFSTPYFDGDQGAMVRAGTAIPDAAAARALRWGIQVGTTARDVMERLEPSRDYREYPGTLELFEAVETGRVDAVMLDTVTLLAYAQDSDEALDVVAQFQTDENYGAVFPKGSSLKADFDRVLLAMIEDGTVARLAREHLEPAFGTDPAAVPVIPLP